VRGHGWPCPRAEAGEEVWCGAVQYCPGGRCGGGANSQSTAARSLIIVCDY
jgi:hypothetical protein